MTSINDLVLIYFEDKPFSFARVEEILPDAKRGWYHITLLLLQIPIQTVTWILRDVYINGGEFTMDGKRMRMEKIAVPKKNPPKPKDPQHPPKPTPDSAKGGGGKVVSLSDRKPKNNMPLKIVLSASRRTDIPAFYMDWFMDRINSGFFETVNPYNHNKTRVPATPDQVHAIVFWSKDFSRFIAGGFGEALLRLGYRLFFNFTVNAVSPVLEPRIPPLADRLRQVDALCAFSGPTAVNWRFDPVCFYTLPDGSAGNNLEGFSEIADAMAAFGISRCVTSFMDHYPKISKRPVPYAGFRFLDPDMATKMATLQKMASELAGTSMRLYTCCESAVMTHLPPDSGIQSGACVSGALLAELFGPGPSLKKDPGQRRAQGCGCTVSTDVGIYHQHPCFHNCLFCYANPTEQTFPAPLRHCAG